MMIENLATLLKCLFPGEATDTYHRGAVCVLHELYGGTDEVPTSLHEFMPKPAIVSVWHSGCKSLSPDKFDTLEEILKEIAIRQLNKDTK
jgi:hypothetical protein